MPQKVKRQSKFDALLHTIDVYDREADRCETGRAFLAGCLLQGALLEASLTAMALVYRESVWRTARYKKVQDRVSKRSHRHVLWLRDFSLNDLEQIERELGWVSGLDADLDALRDTRDFIHPGKYADEASGGKRMNAASYRLQYSRLRRITDQLYKKLEVSIARKLRQA
jgi:hypothetical protein